ncbi:hypothetical protein FNF27_03811 [Cafeteria roenbergensis]|uniref:Uncharacterized protein n=2 Tax=Cafeteria roenbergensis TaxID=33653 RepID=A0A5A8EBQ3_CAFRO|nr:hypothetical protein FNF27_03811 [Cafeteria roenbergensis]
MQRLARSLVASAVRVGAFGGAERVATAAASVVSGLCLALTGHLLRHPVKVGVFGAAQMATDLAFLRCWVLSGCPVAGRKQDLPVCASACLELAARRHQLAEASDAKATFEGRALIKSGGVRWRFLLRPSAALLAGSVPAFERAERALAAVLAGWGTMPKVMQALSLARAVPTVRQARRAQVVAAEMLEPASGASGHPLPDLDPPAVWDVKPGTLQSEAAFEGSQGLWSTRFAPKDADAVAKWVKDEWQPPHSPLVPGIYRLQ